MTEAPEQTPPAKPKGKLEWMGTTVVQTGWALLFMVAGSVYGILSYKLFGGNYAGRFHHKDDLMSVSFLVLVPLVLGVLLSYYYSQRHKTSLWRTLLVYGAPLPIVIFIAGAYLGEGIICILMGSPIIIVAALVGVGIGVLAKKLAYRALGKKLSIIVLLPYALLMAEQGMPTPVAIRTVDRSIFITASPEAIWQHINYPTNIQPSELAQGIAYRIGVPYPIEARTLEPRKGGMRELKWQRGVTFKEEITAWEPNRYIQWNYLFAADSFPPGSLDDHIKIGGHYFNLIDTSYRLTPLDGGTRLDVHVTYKVSTNFNWYSAKWADYLLGDSAEAILQFYKHRSEVNHSYAALELKR